MRSLALLLVAASIVACSHEALPGSAPAYRVVVVQDDSVPDSRDLVTPAVLGLQLALAEAPGIGLEVLDTGGDPARALAAARSAASDPSVLAAVIAPFTFMPAEAVDSLLAARVPVLSLSSIDEPPSRGAHPAWRRFVAPVGAMARALVQVAANLYPKAPVCVLGEDTPWSVRLRIAIGLNHTGVRTRTVTSPVPAALETIRAKGCRTAVWTGTAPGAVALEEAVEGKAELVLDDAARTDGYLVSRWPSAPGALAVCSCSDLSTSEDPNAQLFVHDYQASTGLDAGPFAVEGFDVGTWIVRSVRVGPTRQQVTERVAASTRFGGLTHTYRWDDRGVLDREVLRVYRAVGLRWLVAPAAARALRRGGPGR
jgi:branched-chain amino acid transport system substrate-binding protein